MTSDPLGLHYRSLKITCFKLLNYGSAVLVDQMSLFQGKQTVDTINNPPGICPPPMIVTCRGGVSCLDSGEVPSRPARGRQPEGWRRRDLAKVQARILPRGSSQSRWWTYSGGLCMYSPVGKVSVSDTPSVTSVRNTKKGCFLLLALGSRVQVTSATKRLT